MSDPVIHGEVQILIGVEHFEKDQIGIARILDVVTGNRWNVADIIGIEVHRASPRGGHKYSHSAFAREVKLPLGGIWMPVQLADSSWLERDQCSGDALGYREIVRVDDADFASGCFYCGGHRRHLEGVFDGRRYTLPANCCLVLSQRSRKVGRKDIKLIFR